MASVELRGLTKKYGALTVVDNVSLMIDHGRLMCLLGPSGCGKTTTLRLIAGFIAPDGGEIRVGGKLISSSAKTLPPEQRGMSMIFQSYARLIRPRSENVSIRFLPPPIWKNSPNAIPANYPAASSSASRWRARW